MGGGGGAAAARHPRFRTNDTSRWAQAACDPCSQTDAKSWCALALILFGGPAIDLHIECANRASFP